MVFEHATKARTLRYPYYTRACQISEGSLGRLCFLMLMFSKTKEGLAITESGFYNDHNIR